MVFRFASMAHDRRTAVIEQDVPGDLAGILTAQAAETIYVQDADCYIRLIAQWEHFHGPMSGLLAVPEELAEYDGERADLGSWAEVDRLYARVILHGRETDQADVLNTVLLRERWAWLRLERGVKSVWEQRFPQLLDAPAYAGEQ